MANIPQPREKVHGGRVLAVFTLGLLLVVASVVLPVYWNWRGVWPQVLLALGTTTALGAALFWLQRYFFVETVGAIREEVRQREDAFEYRIQEEVNDIRNALRAETSARHSVQDEKAEAISNDFTFESASGALEYLDHERLTQSDLFRVRASQPLDGLRIAVRQLYAMHREGSRDPQIHLTPWSWRDGRIGSGHPIWQPGETAAFALDRVIAELETAGAHEMRASFDPLAFVENFGASIELANRNRRGETSHTLAGPIIEIFDGDIVLTSAGIESISRGMLVPKGRFPATIHRFQDPGSEKYVRPSAPEGISEETWEILASVAEKTYLGHTSWPTEGGPIASTMPPGFSSPPRPR